MAMTFDATLKHLGRECPHGILAEFDQPPTLPVKLLNVDLSTVTKTADLVLGGRMDFAYQVVRLWERPAEQLLGRELGLAPLAILGRLPEGTTMEDGLAIVAQRLVGRLASESEHGRASKLLTSALLLAELRVSRNVALKIFRGVTMLEESDTYLMILEQGEERGRRADILMFGEERLGAADEPVRGQLAKVTDLERLKRMVRKAATAGNWQEILDTP